MLQRKIIKFGKIFFDIKIFSQNYATHKKTNSQFYQSKKHQI